MLNRKLIGILVLGLFCSLSLSAQMKDASKAPAKQMSRILDINSAAEADIVALGIEKTVARKIVESRPYRNKRELVSRQLLTMDQYDKVKDQIVARQPQ